MDNMISVVIPVYNAEKYIQNTLLSLFQQTANEFEIIIVDDGSKDDSASVADSILKHKNISYRIISQANSGQGIARNTGVHYAKGEWIFFMDADDFIQPYTFEIFGEVLNNYKRECDIVYCSYQYVSNANLFELSKKQFSYQVYNRKEMLQGFLTREKVVLVPGTFYRKDFLKENKVSHNGIRWSEDQYFMWQVLDKINSAIYIDCVLYNYYRHPVSVMSSTSTETILEAYGAFQEMSLSISEHEIRKLLLPRWVLGCLHELAHRSSYDEWEKFGEKTNIREKLRVLLKFPSWEVRMLSVIGLVSKKIMYWVLRKR